MNLSYGIKSILAIDDNKENLFELNALITEAFPGIKFMSASGDFNGLEICRAEVPTVVLLNMTMSGMSGIEICNLLKKDPLLKNIRVIMMTSAESDGDSRIKALDSGADAFLSTPVDRAELTAQVRTMLRISEMEGCLQRESAISRSSAFFEKEPAPLNRIGAYEETKQRPGADADDSKPTDYEIQNEQPLENDLFDHKRKYFEIFNSTSEGIYISDLITRRIIDVNQAFLTMFGFGCKEEVLYGFGNLGTDKAPYSQVEAREYVKKAILEGPQTFEWLAEKKNGERFWAEVTLKLTQVEDKRLIVTIVRNINHRKKIDDTQQFLLNAGKKDAGVDFFKSVTQYLSDSLQMCYVSIDRVMPDQTTMQPFMVYLDGKFCDFDNYALKDTPCGAALGKTIARFDRNVLHAFPGNAIIKHIDAECYIGSTLWSSAGKPMGLIVLMNRQPLEKHTVVETVLTMVSMRVAAELERQETEEALKSSEELYRNLIEKLPDGVYKCTPDGRFISVNPAMISILGYSSREELLAVDLRKDLYFDPEDRVRSVSKVSKHEFNVFKLKKKDLSEVWVEDHSWLNRDEKGNVISREGIIRDVTDRKRNEDRLRILSRAVEQNPVTILITDTLGRIEYVNPKFTDLTGYSPDEVKGQTPSILKSGATSPEEYSGLWQTIREGGEWQGEFKNIKKSGEEYYENTLISPIKDDYGNITHFLAVKEDITERKKAGETIREINRKLAYAQQMARIGNWEIYLPTGELHWSEEMSQLIGFSPVPVHVSELVNIFPAAEYERFMQAFNRAVLEGEPLSLDYRIVGSDGTERYIHDEGAISHDAQGIAIWMYGTSQDITERKQAELALHESNELNSSLLQSIPFGMDIVDEQGKILFQSENLSKLFGQKTGDQQSVNLYHDDQTVFDKGSMYAGIQIGMTRISETNFLPGQRIFQIYHTGMLFKGKKAILEIFQDITEKKAVEKKVKLLAHSLEGISECVSITDTDDILIYVNESFLQTYGYTEQELIGQHINIVRTHETINGHVRDILPETIEGGWRGEIMNKRKDGTEFPILLSTSVIKDENQYPIALIGVAIDITEMKKNREELIAAKESAEESNRLKSAFLATMNHELRTPLNHILGFSELIMSGVATEENVSFASSIHTSGQSLLSIIEGVFDLALVEHANIKLRKQTFSLMDHFMENKASFDNILRTSAKHEQITLFFRPDASWLSSYVTADRSKINQILTNLFRNAVKFTQKGTIEFGYKIEDKSRLTFYVKDTGIGIPTDKQEIIFDFFRQGDDSYTRVYGGIGIGLAISQKIAKILDGELKVVSQPGVGSTFSLTIPVELSEKKEN